MTPLSETTILVPKLVGGGLTVGRHLRNMFWTAGPALGISFVIFQPATARAPRRLHRQESSAGPGDPRLRAVRGHPRLLHAVDRGEGVRGRSGARAGRDWHQGDLRRDGDRLRQQSGNPAIDQLFSRGGMASLLTTVWLVLAALRVRRDHGARRLPRAAPPAGRGACAHAGTADRRGQRERHRAQGSHGLPDAEGPPGPGRLVGSRELR